MLSSLNDLNGRIVANHGSIVCWQWYLRQAYGAVVERIVGSRDAKHGLHDQIIVGRYVAVTQVDVYEGARMSIEPSRLNAHSTTADGPFGSVLCNANATACSRV